VRLARKWLDSTGEGNKQQMNDYETIFGNLHNCTTKKLRIAMQIKNDVDQ